MTSRLCARVRAHGVFMEGSASNLIHTCALSEGLFAESATGAIKESVIESMYKLHVSARARL